MSAERPTTSIATSNAQDVFIRDKSLCQELIGKLTFTQLVYFHVLGRMPTPGQTAVLDACLVTLVEHGFTPSSLATRLIYGSSSEAMQSAIAAGLLGVGNLFVGTVEGAAALIERMLESSDDLPLEARRIAEEHKLERRPIPGFGHFVHKPDDPRTARIFDVARTHGVAGRHIQAIEALSVAVDSVYAKHITVNATGAVAAALGDAGVPAEIMRGFAILARCAGLVGHVHEEQKKPAMRAIWEASEQAVPYDGKAGSRDVG